jgi:hypothetical protein
MDEQVEALSEVMSTDDWPEEWLTLVQIEGELEVRAFWDNPYFFGWSAEGRRHWLTGALGAEVRTGIRGIPVWETIGGRYKHVHLLTDTDLEELRAWKNARAASLSEHVRGLVNNTVEVPGDFVLNPAAPDAQECLSTLLQRARRILSGIPRGSATRTFANTKTHDLHGLFQEIQSRPEAPLDSQLACYNAFFTCTTLFIRMLAEHDEISWDSPPESIREAYWLAMDSVALFSSWVQYVPSVALGEDSE